VRLRSGQSIVLDPGVLPDTSLVVRTDGVDDVDARYAQRVADVFEPEWEFESDQPPFLWRVLLGRAAPTASRNRTDEPVRVLIVSTMLYPDVVEHLDTGVIVVLTAPADQMGVDDIGLAFSRENAIDPSAGPPAT
jgi:hypothetical protein